MSVSDLAPRGKSVRPQIITLLALAAAAALSGCASGVRVKDTTKSFTTVVIDAGHGGYDAGARSRWGGAEKNHALSVAHRLESKLRGAGFTTVMTRRSDHFVELNQRARISNRQSNAIFVSVHFNYSPNRRISGSEVYYKSPVSRGIAHRILAEIDAIPGCSARFVKSANFRVLRRNEYPAVLVECGYLTNRSEGSRCRSSTHHERLAAAIATAIAEQRGRSLVPPAPSPAPATDPAQTAPTASVASAN